MTKTVFLGASLVEGVGASSPQQRFSAVASRVLGWEEVNLGIAGKCVTGRDSEGQVLDEDSGLGRVPDVLEAKPDLVVVMHGGNDFVQSVPMGDPLQFQQGTFVWDYDTMVRGLLFEMEPEQILLMTLPARRDGDTPNNVGLTLGGYNSAIRDAGMRRGLRVLDTYADAGLSAATDYAEDGIHPNDAGHQCLAAFLIQAMQTSK